MKCAGFLPVKLGQLAARGTEITGMRIIIIFTDQMRQVSNLVVPKCFNEDKA